MVVLVRRLLILGLEVWREDMITTAWRWRKLYIYGEGAWQELGLCWIDRISQGNPAEENQGNKYCNQFFLFLPSLVPNVGQVLKKMLMQLIQAMTLLSHLELHRTKWKRIERKSGEANEIYSVIILSTLFILRKCKVKGI